MESDVPSLNPALSIRTPRFPLNITFVVEVVVGPVHVFYRIEYSPGELSRSVASVLAISVSRPEESG